MSITHYQFTRFNIPEDLNFLSTSVTTSYTASYVLNVIDFEKLFDV
jgi:hypothetical protein